MSDRQKVIKGLECIAQQPQNGTCGGCAYFRPYRDDPDCGWCDRVAIANDALTLLREQEAVKPISAHVWAHTFGRCGNCEAPLPALEGLRSKFCWMCGKAVKWYD